MERALDCRGLPPPEPLVRILAQTDTLKPPDVIEAWLDRRPLVLFPELDERGFAYRCFQRADGVHVVRIAAHPADFNETNDAP